MFRPEEPYQRRLAEEFEPVAKAAQDAARELRPDEPEMAEQARASICFIGGYQVWSSVVRDQVVVDGVVAASGLDAFAVNAALSCTRDRGRGGVAAASGHLVDVPLHVVGRRCGRRHRNPSRS